MVSFDLPDVNDVSDVIHQLKNPDQGHDGRGASLIKDVLDPLCKPLTHVLTLSMKTAIGPADLKVPKVLPLYKLEIQ